MKGKFAYIIYAHSMWAGTVLHVLTKDDTSAFIRNAHAMLALFAPPSGCPPDLHIRIGRPRGIQITLAKAICTCVGRCCAACA